MIALYPGTFDPITNGHFEIIRRASTLFGDLVVGVAKSSEKNPLFSLDQRLEMVNEVLNSFNNIEVAAYDGLTINFAKSIEARVIVRGLRSPADGQYEFELASMNKRLADDIETVFLSSGDQNAFISSSLIRQIAQEGGNISDFVHPTVQNALAEAYKK
jgi:pantetheine-phosphate adenylyltransferase